MACPFVVTLAAAVVTEVEALACELPTQTEVPLARWGGPELAREAVGRGICRCPCLGR